MKNLLNATPEELKGMNKLEVHEGYKTILENILMDFYIECSDNQDSIKTILDLNCFIKAWIKKKIKPPHPEWNPGDCGK